MSVSTPGADVEKVKSWIILILEGEAVTPRGATPRLGIRPAVSRGKTNARPSRTSSALLTTTVPAYGFTKLWLPYFKAAPRSRRLLTLPVPHEIIFVPTSQYEENA